MHLVCPACSTTNRVPEARLHSGPVCGKCKAQLMASEPLPLSDHALPGFIANTELPVLVDFWAAWCGPCKTMAPQFASAATQLPDVRFIKVDSDAAPIASAHYGIRSIPTMVLFHRGRELNRISGAVTAGDLVSWVRRSVRERAS